MSYCIDRVPLERKTTRRNLEIAGDAVNRVFTERMHELDRMLRTAPADLVRRSWIRWLELPVPWAAQPHVELDVSWCLAKTVSGAAANRTGRHDQ
jgi:hypothetical protein